MKSSCCNEEVRVEGDTTKYFVCEKCGKACDEANTYDSTCYDCWRDIGDLSFLEPREEEC